MAISGSGALGAGGASGLGLATTEQLLAAGASVVILDLPGSPGEAIADKLGERVRFSPGDVTDEAGVSAALDRAAGLGPLRVAVNCAGTGNGIMTLGKKGPFPLADFSRIININLICTFNVIRLAAERIAANVAIKGERGVIVNPASLAAFDGQIGQAAYSASKGGIVGMTLPVARDLAVVGVRLNCVAPGLFDTPIYGEGPASEAFKDTLKRDVLFPKRLGRAEELATMIVELLTNSYMNAEVLRVDGGARLQPK